MTIKTRWQVLSPTQWAKVVDANRRNRECIAAGTHPTDSGERSTAVLGGKEYRMARCSVCTIRYPAPEEASSE